MCNKRDVIIAAAALPLAAWLGAVPLWARPDDAAPRLVPQADAACSLTWPAHLAEVEACLRDCEVDRIEDVPIGVTRPKRVYFKEGSLLRSAAWKPLPPGRQKGYWESYKSEIAAYQLDRLLGLDMVPPAVERRIEGDLGAAILWVDSVHGWDAENPPTAPDQFAWSRQVVRMKMLDQLIANIDRNEGNLLYDDDFHLFLIDHSRAFTTEKNISKMAQSSLIDAGVWDKMEALTFEQLKDVLGPWMAGDREVRAILERRDRMKKQIDNMVKDKGTRFVFIR